MLLADELLAFAEAWRYREKVEWQAADQFERLANDLTAIEADATLISMAEQAARDECEHAGLCRAIVDKLHPGLEALRPELGYALGPNDLSLRRRALYTSVALSCITESLSTALLIEMRDRSEDELVKSTVKHILKDEIQHSRLGWAHLAWEAERADVTWLSAHVADMLGASMTTDQKFTGEATGEPFGILSPQRSQETSRSALGDVVFPGFELYGIDTAAARAAVVK